MTIEHHPTDEFLVRIAAGSLPGGESLLVSTHLEGCERCRDRLHLLQAVGGALLDEIEHATMAPDAWVRTLARIDERESRLGSAARPLAAKARPSPPLALPGGMAWPASLGDCKVSRWHWMGPGMHYARLSMPHDPAAALFLLRIAEGRHLPRHTHEGLELTQVLHGSFDDGRAVFGAGDFDAADADVHHQPVVTSGGECVCLAHVGGSLRFDGRIAATIGGWIGM